MHRNPETLTTLGSSGTKLLLPSWLLGFRHEERERDNFTMLTVSTSFFSQLPSWILGQESVSQPTDPKKARASRSLQTGLASPSVKSPLASSSVKSQLCFFQKSPKFPLPRFRAWRHSHPGPFFGFLLWHLWLSHPPCASVNCTQCVHLHVH